MRILLGLILVILITACSPQKRINRLLNKVERISDENDLSIETKDTFYHTENIDFFDTINLDSSQISESFELKKLDTKQFFVIEDELVKTTVTLYPPTARQKSKIDIKTTVKERKVFIHDTIEIEVPFYVDKKIFIREHRTKWYDWLLRISFFIFIVVMIVKYFVKAIDYIKSIASK